MNNSYDEIKKLLKASNNMLKGKLNEDVLDIKKRYGILTEQEYETAKGSDVVDKINPIKATKEKIDSEVGDEETEEKSEDTKQQAYRISGGILTIHGNDQGDLELTTDEKTTFQDTMDEFIDEVSDLVDFQTLNVYSKDVEWGGKIIDFDMEFYFTIGENNGIYINGTMMKVDQNFLDTINKLQSYYEKFKSKWAKVLASRKKTSQNKNQNEEG
jgi:hypothetical protein